MPSRPDWDKIRKANEPKREFGEAISVPSSVALAFRARDAVEFLIDHQTYYPGTKNDFAMAMGWVRPDGRPLRDWVEGICTYTRDHPDDELTGGYVISYAPTRGGMVLWTGEDDAPLDHYVHMFQGDMTRDKQHRIENRRRKHIWAKAAQQAHESGDLELARLLNYAENEINSTGFVAESTAKQLQAVFASRDFGEN
jgi:hypothetical protein